MISRILRSLVAPGRLLRPLAADRRGATAVQFALIATPLFLFLFGIEETARVMWTQAAINMAVEDAARFSSVNGAVGACTAPGQVKNYAASRAWGLSLPTGDFTATSPACGCQVTASVPFTPIVPNLVPYNLTLTATACFPQWS
ncbi:MAG TPA: TadE/TadG family type IV pilus assembly protein [Stellaceae bacterium]|nr:TadE/TadG family type IV pilus assembly protein [Stellaceae bacterium]